MFIDIEKEKQTSSYECEVCIIGAGPAGLTVAQELLDTDLDVIILESGNLHSSRRAQMLSAGSLSGALYEPPEDWHVRQVGGTANHWIVSLAGGESGYRFAPLSSEDFDTTESQEFSGWPISFADLEPYYHRVCEMAEIQYEPPEHVKKAANDALPFLEKNFIRTGFFSFARTDLFAKDIPRQLRESKSRLFYNATVVELKEDVREDRVDHALVRLFSGREIKFRAKHFVVACGGVQTARLLLCSTEKLGCGIGNTYDNVGRYYMDHSLVPSGNFFPKERKFFKRIQCFDAHTFGETMFLGFLAIDGEYRKRKGLRNIAFSIFPMPSKSRVRALGAMKSIVRNLRSLKFHNLRLTDIIAIFSNFFFVVRTVYSAVVCRAPLLPGFGVGGWSNQKNFGGFERVELLAFVEQSPNPNNRVTLTDDVDALGMRKVNVHFEWSESDLESILKAQQLVGDAFGQIRDGEFVADCRPIQPHIGSLGLHHSLGTTRMGSDPKSSVVDKDCRVHGVDNLFIASSSVFATGGFANPTFSILALSIRIADKMKSFYPKLKN